MTNSTPLGPQTLPRRGAIDWDAFDWDGDAAPDSRPDATPLPPAPAPAPEPAQPVSAETPHETPHETLLPVPLPEGAGDPKLNTKLLAENTTLALARQRELLQNLPASPDNLAAVRQLNNTIATTLNTQAKVDENKLKQLDREDLIAKVIAEYVRMRAVDAAEQAASVKTPFRPNPLRFRPKPLPSELNAPNVSMTS
jgi:hypothetical protein